MSQNKKCYFKITVGLPIKVALKVLCSGNLTEKPVEISEEREASLLSMGESLKLLSPEDGNIASLQIIGEFLRGLEL